MRHTEAAQQATLPRRPLCRWRVSGEPSPPQPEKWHHPGHHWQGLVDAQQGALAPVEQPEGHTDPDESAAKQNATTRHLEVAACWLLNLVQKHLWLLRKSRRRRGVCSCRYCLHFLRAAIRKPACQAAHIVGLMPSCMTEVGPSFACPRHQNTGCPRL